MTNHLTKQENLYTAIVAFYCIIMLLSNLFATKLFQAPFSIVLPVGLLTYPITFLLGDLVTEIFGKKKAQFMIGLAFFLMATSTLMIQFSLWLPAHNSENQKVFEQVFGLNLLVSTSSLIAFLTGQLIDIQIYSWMQRKNSTGLCIRSLGSTLPSQFIDSSIVCFSLYFFGMGLSIAIVIQIILTEYTYKALVSLMNTPLFYFAVNKARKYTAAKPLVC